MNLVIDSHTLLRALERGTTESEIREVFATGFPMTARKGRLGMAKVFPFGGVWNERYYEEKRVEIIYRIEADYAQTVTVYVFYGKWETDSEDRIPG